MEEAVFSVPDMIGTCCPFSIFGESPFPLSPDHFEVAVILADDFGEGKGFAAKSGLQQKFSAVEWKTEVDRSCFISGGGRRW
jgi:hypothetical protein